MIVTLQIAQAFLGCAEVTELRGAMAYLQSKLAGLEKELLVMQEGKGQLLAQCSASKGELDSATERAEHAEADKIELIKLVDEVSFPPFP